MNSSFLDTYYTHQYESTYNNYFVNISKKIGELIMFFLRNYNRKLKNNLHHT